MNHQGTVADDEVLHRRIHSSFRRPDGRMSSQAFRDPELSADRAILRSVQETMNGFEGFGLASLTAQDARMNGQDVVPEPDIFNPAHAIVRGNKTKSIARALARAAAWVISLPPGYGAASA